MPRKLRPDSDPHSGLYLGVEGLFLSEPSVCAAKKMKSRHVEKKIETAYGEIVTRKLVPCKFRDEPMLADIVTGSLYEAYSGRCLTGSRWLVDAPGRVALAEKRYDGVDLASVWKRKNGRRPRESKPFGFNKTQPIGKPKTTAPEA